MPPTPARVLIIAGSDSGGGAGIQGDLKTVQALGGYGMTAITALTAQNTLGVSGIFSIPPEFIVQQIRACLDDIGADAIKTGMLHSAEVIEAIASAIPHDIPLIIDPVITAKGGASLLADAALDALKVQLIPRAILITPNLPEAELLLGYAIPPTEEAMKIAAQQLLQLGCEAVLLKGGHARDAQGNLPPQFTDILLTLDGAALVLRATPIATRNTHGTGCTFASAVATGIAQKLSLTDAVRRAHSYVQEAIARAPNIGKGHGPLGH